MNKTYQSLRSMARSGCFLLVALILSSSSVFALENGLARTPPMGWNSWNWFGCRGYPLNNGTLDENMVKQMADAMASNGMKEAGYRFINMDDCWGLTTRTATKGISADPTLFKGGMRNLAKYVHAKGLKLGVYTDAWNATCAKNLPGMYGHEDQDADTFVAWGIDYVKVDNCERTFADNTPAAQVEDISRNQYIKIRDALKNAVLRAKAKGDTSAHDIVYSICSWGWGGVNEKWGDTVGNLWRIGGDISIKWDEFWLQIDAAIGLYSRAKPGAWNDPDMLEVGNGLTANEDRVHFAVWCMLAAPLIAGNDIRNMTTATKTLMVNKDIIDVNQDSLGIQCRDVVNEGTKIIFSKKVTDGYAVLYVNKSNSAITMNCAWDVIGKADPKKVGLSNSTKMFGKNLFTHQYLGAITTGNYTVTVPARDCAMIRLYTSDPQTGTRNATNKTTVAASGLSIRYEGANIIFVPKTADPVSMTLVNLKGAVISSKQVTASEKSWVVQKASMSSGLYFIKSVSKNVITCQEVLIK